MFHKVSLIGNLGQEPETRFLQSGSSVCSFSIATNRRWTNSDGTPGQETIWWRASAWGKLGEICQQYLSKGQLIFVEGTMVPDRETNGPRVWTDQNGQPRASFELRIETMKMLGRREGGGGYAEGGYGQSQSRPASAPQQYSAPARQAPQRQASAPQRQAPAPQRQAPAPQRQAPAPQQRSTPRPAAAGRQAAPRRRSTQSAPQTNDFSNDDFGPDEIPF